MRTGLNAIGAHSESSAMIGDRMDTDVLAGLEAGMHTFWCRIRRKGAEPARPSPSPLRMRKAAGRVNLPEGGSRCVPYPSRSVGPR
ncbi:HAD hydrolase-like protein [Streptomyces atratus]|uniref:HAD hydrolase-like protein n=1 Tax=Streptomyces atratus TaxID=1893 RepID=UPI003F541E38